MSRFALMPTLAPHERQAMLEFLRTSLTSPRLCANYPLTTGRISIYVDGVARAVVGGTWMLNYDGLSMKVGRDEQTNVPLVDRLGVLCAIISACGLWEELVDVYSAAAGRVLLESYNEMMNGLLATRGALATGLAFSASQQLVAARFGDTWHLPNGQEVDLSAPEWQEATVVN